MDTGGNPIFYIKKPDLAINFNVAQRGRFSVKSVLTFISTTLPLLISKPGGWGKVHRAREQQSTVEVSEK